MPASPKIRKALEGIPAYRAGRVAPEGAVKLSSNENPYFPLPGVIAAIQDAATTINRYPDFASDRLLAALADKHQVSKDCIALGTGSVAVLAQTIQAVAGVGDEVVVPWRSFEAYPILVTLAGATLVKVPLREDHTHDVTAMLQAVTSRTRLMLVCSPNNPTGTIVDPNDLCILLDEAPKDVLIAIDEAYIEFVADELRVPTISLIGERDNVLSLRTFSKAYGLAALRVGYAVAPVQIAQALRKAQLPFGVSAIAEQAALASLANEPQLLERVAQIVIERQRVASELRAASISFAEPHGNFIWLPVGERAIDFATFLEGRGIVARAFEGDGVRVTIGEPTANDIFVAATIDYTNSDESGIDSVRSAR